MPDDLDALRALPGIGPYTARAVLAFAFERDVAVVDTNIARVLARVAGERLTLRRVQDAADALVPAGAGWAWNQVLMDLGATVCRPAPRCARVPARRRRARGTSPVTRRPTRPPARPASAPARRRTRAATARPAAPCCGPSTTAPGRPPTFDARIVAGLVADRLVVRTGDLLHLP